MALQILDYSKIPTQHSGMADLFGKALEGYRMGRMPRQIQQEEESRQHANAIQALREHFMPEQQALQMEKGRQQLSAARENQEGARQNREQEQQLSHFLASSGDPQQQSAPQYPERGGEAQGADMGQTQGERQVAQQSRQGRAPTGEDGAAAIKRAFEQKNNPVIGGAEIVSQGNPQEYAIDAMYDSHPEMRKRLESRGFKKKVSTKVDKDTGDTVITTTHPSGKIEVRRGGGDGLTKGERDLELYKKKDQYNREQDTKLPAAVKTLHENKIQIGPVAIDALQKIRDTPAPLEPWGTKGLYADEKAAHHAAVLAAAENYVKANGWPNNLGSIEKAGKMLERGSFETRSGYRQRLKGYQQEIDKNVTASKRFLYPNRIKQDSQTLQDRRDESRGENIHIANQEMSRMSDAELRKIAGGN